MKRIVRLKHRRIFRIVLKSLYIITIYHLLLGCITLINIYSTDLNADLPSEKVMQKPWYTYRYIETFFPGSSICMEHIAGHIYCRHINQDRIVSMYEFNRSQDSIIVLGDSFSQADGVHTNQTYAYILDQLLPKHQVINLGVNGFDTYQEVERYLRLGKRYPHELIILQVLSNDVLNSGELDNTNYKNFFLWEKYSVLRFTRADFGLPDMLNSLNAKRAYAHYKDHPLEITDRRMIQQIDRLTNSTDAKLIILSFRIDTYQRSAINAYCKDRCMHIDLEKEIDYNQHDPLMILHEEDRHPSPYLHNLTAHYIKKKLEEKRLI